jgi:hypothetical protein
MLDPSLVATDVPQALVRLGFSVMTAWLERVRNAPGDQEGPSQALRIGGRLSVYRYILTDPLLTGLQVLPNVLPT